MKKTGIFFVLFFSTGFTMAQVQRTVKAVKQNDSTGNTHEKNRTTDQGNKRKQLQQLALSNVQKSQIKEIRQSEKTKKDAISNNDSLTAVQKDAMMRDLKKEQAKNIQSVLNAEQKAKLRNMLTDMKKNRQNNKNN